jgi:hypothetical protein
MRRNSFIGDGPGTFDMVYGAVAVPLPSTKLNVDKIEGDNVRKKWVNFLLAETGDEEGGGSRCFAVTDAGVLMVI